MNVDRRALWASVVAAMIDVSAAAQLALPPHHDRTLHASDVGLSYHTFWRGPSGELSYRLGLDNVEDNVIEIRWGANTDNAWKLKDQYLYTSYRPLSVTADGGLSSTLYVTGWFERTGEIVVERWQIGTTVLSISTTPGGTEVVDFALPRITREELMRSYHGAIFDAVFHPASRKLIWLSDKTYDGSQREIISVDVDAESPTRIQLFDADDIPILDECEGMNIGVTDDASESVYVFIFTDYQWNIGPSGSGEQTHVLCDADRDGYFEISYHDDYAEVAESSALIDWTTVHEADPAP